MTLHSRYVSMKKNGTYYKWRGDYKWQDRRDKMKQSVVPFETFAKRLLEKELERNPIIIDPPDGPAVA